MFRFGQSRRAPGAILALVLCFFVQLAAAGVPVVTRFRSPKNPDRPVRKATTLIVLHTTEAPAKGSLRHLSERGECHYCVTEDGLIYQIVDRHRVAFHAGTSMWNGKTEVDNFSVGIECVGYHDKPMPLVQLKAISALVKELQAIYRITDDKVVTHSMVAYGEANKWQKKKHRGRKRCGMLFAMPSVRHALNLKSRVAYDPDTKAKRLVVGDDFLQKVLYGKVDTMRKTYGAARIAEVSPVKGSVYTPPPAVAGKSVSPTPSPAVIPQPASPPQRPTASFSLVPQTIHELNRLGYVCVGTITKKNLPLAIVGKLWNSPSTFYTIRGRVIPGNIINPQRFEEGTGIWIKK